MVAEWVTYNMLILKHSRRNPFYMVLLFAGLGYVGCVWRPGSLPAYQTFAALLSAAYAAMIGHHAVTKDVEQVKAK